MYHEDVVVNPLYFFDFFHNLSHSLFYRTLDWHACRILALKLVGVILLCDPTFIANATTVEPLSLQQMVQKAGSAAHFSVLKVSRPRPYKNWATVEVEIRVHKVYFSHDGRFTSLGPNGEASIHFVAANREDSNSQTTDIAVGYPVLEPGVNYVGIFPDANLIESENPLSQPTLTVGLMQGLRRVKHDGSLALPSTALDHPASTSLPEGLGATGSGSGAHTTLIEFEQELSRILSRS